MNVEKWKKEALKGFQFMVLTLLLGGATFALVGAAATAGVTTKTLWLLVIPAVATYTMLQVAKKHLKAARESAMLDEMAAC